MKKVLLSLVCATAAAVAMSNLELAKKVDDVVTGFKDSRATMSMTMINAHGQQSVREMKLSSLENKKGDMGLMEFLTPADVRGTKMLTHEHLNKNDDQWLYLPALKRVKRIASRNKSGSFMGSEFSYEDIGNQSYEKFKYDGEAKEISCGEDKCYESVRIPNDKYSGYKKQIVWIYKDRFLVKKIDYYDRKNSLLKSAEFSGYKKINGFYRIGKIHMKNFQNSKETILEWKNEEIGVGLSKKDFSKRALR